LQSNNAKVHVELQIRTAHAQRMTHASPPNEGAPLHVIFGAGQVGTLLAQELLAAGCRVRIVRRSAKAWSAPGLSWAHGDLNDQTFVRAATSGAEVIYNCTNPEKYDQWERLLPPLYRACADAAAMNNARLVMLDNVYLYGDTQGEVMRESSPIAAKTKKGRLRGDLYREMRRRAQSEGFHLTFGRASDFFGPNSTLGAVFSTRSHQRLLKGQAVEVLGNIDLVHSYSFVPDVARGLAMLGLRPIANGDDFHLPVAWQGTTRDLIVAIAQQLGSGPVKFRHVPRWILRTMGLAFPLAAAVEEMVYQWENPFVVSDQKFCEHYRCHATSPQTAIAATAVSVLAQHGHLADRPEGLKMAIKQSWDLPQDDSRHVHT
jgi:nucleoside-diphosphate-sugar epimerase